MTTVRSSVSRNLFSRLCSKAGWQHLPLTHESAEAHSQQVCAESPGSEAAFPPATSCMPHKLAAQSFYSEHSVALALYSWFCMACRLKPQRERSQSRAALEAGAQNAGRCCDAVVWRSAARKARDRSRCILRPAGATATEDYGNKLEVETNEACSALSFPVILDAYAHFAVQLVFCFSRLCFHHPDRYSAAPLKTIYAASSSSSCFS